MAADRILLTTPNPLFRLREQHTGRWFGHLRRQPDAPWASAPSELDPVFTAFRRIPSPGRINDKWRMEVPALLD